MSYVTIVLTLLKYLKVCRTMSVSYANSLEYFLLLITGLRKINVLIPDLKSLGLQTWSNPETQMMSIGLRLFLGLAFSVLAPSFEWVLLHGDNIAVSSTSIMPILLTIQMEDHTFSPIIPTKI